MGGTRKQRTCSILPEIEQQEAALKQQPQTVPWWWLALLWAEEKGMLPCQQGSSPTAPERGHAGVLLSQGDPEAEIDSVNNEGLPP